MEASTAEVECGAALAARETFGGAGRDGALVDLIGWRLGTPGRGAHVGRVGAGCVKGESVTLPPLEAKSGRRDCRVGEMRMAAGGGRRRGGGRPRRESRFTGTPGACCSPSPPKSQPKGLTRGGPRAASWLAERPAWLRRRSCKSRSLEPDSESSADRVGSMVPL